MDSEKNKVKGIAFFVVEFDKLKEIFFDMRKGDLGWMLPTPFVHVGGYPKRFDLSDVELLGFHYDHTNERLLMKVKTNAVEAFSAPVCLGSVKFRDDMVCEGCGHWDFKRNYCKEKCTETGGYTICKDVKEG